MIKLFETFAGYGGASFGLKKANIEFECIGYSEVDKYAIQCYEQNHKGQNYGDISKINPNELPNFDILTGGFPCQDVSIAGKRDLSKGRTLLIEHIFRIVKIKKPKYLFLENVKGLLSMPNLWDSIRYTLKNLGYGVSYKVLNSKDYGIPQNRERIWIVCKYGGWTFLEFQFPFKEKLTLFVDDILEKNVDKKYYLTQKAINRLIKDEGFTSKITKNIASTLTTAESKVGRGMNLIADYRFDEGLRIRKDQTSPCLSATMREDLNAMPSHSLLVVPVLTPDRLEKRQNGRRFKTGGEPMFTLNTQDKHGIYDGKLIRRLTPIECFRLMGFLNDEINLKGISDSRLYKLAGNGWDVNLVSKIFKNLFGG